MKACFSLVLWLTVALVPAACRPSLHEISERAEERVKIDKAGKEETGKGKANSEAPKPMLVIDVTLSMAGYFAPPEQPATEFSKALDVLSGALTGHDLYTFGDRKAREGLPIQQILTYQPAGIGREFYRDELFTGQFNQDDLLFQAAGRQSEVHPLVFVTDGVYSSPQGNGVQPVFQALDSLLARGWSLGLVALRSTYYGTRCNLIPGQPCGDGARLFFSEARSQRGMAQFFRMPPCAVPARPFYVVVLAPTSETFNQLAAKLRERLHPEGTFLIAGNVQPVTVTPPRVFARAGEQKADFYGAKPELRWLMLDKGGPPIREIAVGYSVTPEFPVDRLSWAVKAESLSWSSAAFGGDWRPASVGLGIGENLTSSQDDQAAGSPALFWSGFDREIADLQASFGHIRSLGDIVDKHSAAVKEIEAWRPATAELGPLYCEYMERRFKPARNERVSKLKILLAVDALRRQQFEEASGYLGKSVLATAYDSEGGALVALARDLAGLSPRRTSLAPGVSLPASNSQTLPAGESQESRGPAVEGEQIVLRLPLSPEARTYRFVFTPHPLSFPGSLGGLTTNDDSDIAFADRTYRLGTLIEALSAAQLERIGRQGDLTVYVTVPGR